MKYGRNIRDGHLSLCVLRNLGLTLFTGSQFHQDNVENDDLYKVLLKILEEPSNIKMVMIRCLEESDFGRFSFVHPKFQMVIAVILKYCFDRTFIKTTTDLKVIIFSLRVLGVDVGHIFMKSLYEDVFKEKVIKDSPWFHLATISNLVLEKKFEENNVIYGK